MAPPKKYLTEEERREAQRERVRRYYQKNRKAVLEHKKQYRAEHAEERRDHNRKYCKENPEKSKKSFMINNWKQRGLIHDDYDGLYAEYTSSTHCEECGIPYGKYGDGSGTYRCMDHEHQTGKFRNFLCNRCNLRRGHEDRAKLEQLETELPSE